MRRYRLVPMLALAVVVLGACGSNTAQTPRTITTVVTKTGAPPPTTSGTGGSAGITVVGSGDASAPGTGSTSTSTPSDQPSTTPSPTGKSGTSGTPGKTTKTSKSSKPQTSTKTTPKKPPKVVKVDPLHVSCSALLDSHDIKKALGASVPSASSRIVDVANPDVKMTGKIKCYFGSKTGSKSRPVTVALAQYKSAHAAQAQMDVTASSEVSLGAKSSSLKVSGHPARVLLRDGGLLVMRYDTWTLSVAVENKLVSNSKLPHGMQSLARMVLARVLKNG